MKNLKIKFGLFSLLAVLAVSVFLTACEQEEISNQLQEEEGLRNYVLETQLESAQFEKSLVVENRSEKKFGINNMDFIIKSNDEAILQHFNENTVLLKIGDVTIEEEQINNTEDRSENTNIDNLSGFEENQKFVQIILIGSTNAPTSIENVGFSLKFSDELSKMILKNKIATVIDFGIDESQVQLKYQSHFFWNNNKLIGIGTSSNSSARTYNYWSYTNNSTSYFLNSRYVKRNGYGTTSVCCIDSDNKWVRRVAVTSGLADVYGVWNWCVEPTCGRNDYY